MDTPGPVPAPNPAEPDPAQPAAPRRDVGGQLVGAVISAFFGAMWAVGCAVVLFPVARPAGIAVAVAGLLIGAALVVVALSTWRRDVGAGGPRGRNAMFASRGYRVIVVIEVLAIVAAGPVSGRLGLGDYVVIWVAFVVGVHFLGFGKLFWRGFFLIGAAILVGVAAALVLALTRPTAVPAGVTVTAVSSVVLLLAGTAAVRDARAHRAA